ncbi:MAG TPA: tetratricopeptide repeat protein [Holophagaceae bacterium]|jgi:tetratricopeptide (TPR) repeat protein|nr:tetratricopeptide repeat protein [Holophagaceae bacterium]
MTKLLRLLLVLAVLAGSGAGAWKAWRSYEARRSPRILMLDPAVAGIDRDCAMGLGRLLRDQLEVSSASTVIVLPRALPPDIPPGDLLLRFSGHREGGSLSLRAEWIAAGKRGSGAAWTVFETPMTTPAEAFRRLEGGLPVPSFHSGAGSLVPRDSISFWDLARQTSIQEDVAADADLEASRSLAESVPDSAAAWVNLGEHIYRNLWTQPADSDLPQAQAIQAFDRALDLVPGYPRAALLKGMLLADIGDQRAALRTLADARALRPQVPDVYSGMAYAARTSGLLDGALRSLTARNRLTRPFHISEDWFAENTYLYSGRWDEFRNSLPGNRDPLFLFYRGYLDLARGDRAEALTLFEEGAADRRTSLPFSDLCTVYALAIRGRQDEALGNLKVFEEERGRLRIPDGELTFKVAEAYAFLGRPEEALTAAGRAFAQGFGCLAWYEQSPLFAPARHSPRWEGLRQHIRERQKFLDEAFPPDSFG